MSKVCAVALRVMNEDAVPSAAAVLRCAPRSPSLTVKLFQRATRAELPQAASIGRTDRRPTTENRLRKRRMFQPTRVNRRLLLQRLLPLVSPDALR